MIDVRAMIDSLRPRVAMLLAAIGVLAGAGAWAQGAAWPAKPMSGIPYKCLPNWESFFQTRVRRDCLH